MPRSGTASEVELMDCPYCRARNDADDHRCNRCGRRLNETARPQVLHGNVAPALNRRPDAEVQPRVRPSLVVVPTPSPAPPEKQGSAMQASLFGPQIVTAAPVEPVATPRKQPVLTKSRQDRAGARERQAYFDFDASLAAGADCPTRDTAMAPTALRVISAGVDLAVALGGAAVFFGTLLLIGETNGIEMKTVAYYGAAVLFISMFYKLLFCLSGADTPGMRWMGLRLVNFDGHPPTRQQRLKRLGGGVLSVLSAGLGLVWALFDEHKLTWHDQISGTFPTVD